MLAPGLRLARESAVREAELFLALEVDAGGAESLVRCASEVRRAWLDPARVETRTELAFDPGEARVVARVVTAFEYLELPLMVCKVFATGLVLFWNFGIRNFYVFAERGGVSGRVGTAMMS